jgi:hypothetical protein
MELWMWIVLAVIAVVVIGAGGYLWQQRQRTEELTGRFGPEYQRAVEDTGDRRAAERELAAREERVREMEIRPLDPADRTRFAEEWRQVQARFVDDPAGSISIADRLVQEVMQERGFETDGGFDQRAADVSVQHARVVPEYRRAHEIAERHASDGVPTEELRQAMVHYRAVFEDLLEPENARQPVAQGSR